MASLFSDAVTRKILSQQIVRGEFPGDFAKAVLGAAQILRQQLAGTGCQQLAPPLDDGGPRPMKRVEMAAAGHEYSLPGALEPHAGLEVLTQLQDTLTGPGGEGNHRHAWVLEPRHPGFQGNWRQVHLVQYHGDVGGAGAALEQRRPQLS